MTWQERAACRDADIDLFFRPGNCREAKAICAGCPVRLDCIDWALEHDCQFGVFGGIPSTKRRTTGATRHGSWERFRAGCRCGPCCKRVTQAVA